MPNTRITVFTATNVASTPVGPNAARRWLKVQVYSTADVPANVTAWVDHSGKAAVAQQCFQVIAGGLFEWGVLNPREFTHGMNLVNCPTGPISVITSSGSSIGIIEEGIG